MGGLTPLPGEREVLRLHPHPLGWLGHYAAALPPLLWGGATWLLFHAGSWQDSTGVQRVFVGSPFAAHLWAAGGVLLGGYALAKLRRRATFLIAALAIAGLASAITLLRGLDETEALPILVAASALPLLAWAELRRLGTRYHLTTLRLVQRTTFPARTERAERHAELGDIDVRQGPFGKMLDVGTLLPIPNPPAAQPLRLVGVRPLRRVRHLIEVLVRQATATDYLRERLDLEKQQAEALAALHRR